MRKLNLAKNRMAVDFIVNQQIKNSNKEIKVYSACICTPYRKDLVAVAVYNENAASNYYLVKKDFYDSSRKKESYAYFTGPYVKINKDMYNLTTLNYSQEEACEVFPYTHEQYNNLMNWFKNLKL